MTLQPCIHQHAYLANKDIFLYNHIIITHKKISNESLLLLFSHLVYMILCNPWTAALQASLSLTISWSLPKFMSIALVMPSNRLIL